VLDPGPLDATIEFVAESNGTLTANFFEIIYQVNFNVNPPEVGLIEVNDDVLEPLPNTLTLPGEVDIPVSTRPIREFYEFTHWSVSNTSILPDEFTSDVEMNFTGNAQVIANYVELPNYEITLEVEPPRAGWIKLGDTLLKDLPFTKRELGDEFIQLTAIDRGKYGFSHWEVVFGVPVDDRELANQPYYFGAPARIIAHFDERISSVFIPTSFTPNGDGLNDIFKVIANEIELEDFRFSVLNRWGQEIFTTTDIERGWNGSVNGGDYYADPGVYTYFVRFTNSVTGEIEERFGSVTVIR
jgi:gliding motility-associated-like protein